MSALLAADDRALATSADLSSDVPAVSQSFEDDGAGEQPEHPPAPPKPHEALLRGLWSAGHRAMSGRQLGGWVKYFAPTYRDAVTHFEGAATVAITVDDAPSDAGLMHRALDALKACGVRATIFVVADFCADPARLATLRRALAEGHELGNHLCEDVSAQKLGPAAFEAALRRCDAVIASLDPDWRSRDFRWFRPPQGYLADWMRPALDALGYATALADVFPLDTEVRNADWMVDFVLREARPGSIVLIHAPDVRGKHLRQNNVEVFAKLLPRLKAAHALGTLS
eukprot:CAMPEP_0119267412 /NCGR_PEP_ID=MMETSP1329-20130426/5562_1 /TAXON_ID=114041 /ORGANISM="Genus nov. species nov., Strain RCC1024" /LENGTH=283 /DNA_ID=CAMNT_0007267335 /DNA_START=279 /DNA_END=1127 /DNA_ORIENTATION=-